MDESTWWLLVVLMTLNRDAPRGPEVDEAFGRRREGCCGTPEDVVRRWLKRTDDVEDVAMKGGVCVCVCVYSML